MQVQDVKFMRRALALARRGEGRVHPNPLVGAVLVRSGRVLAEGAHERFGGAHAEAGLLKKFKRVPPSATLYVTLEPCCHRAKKTPPCVPTLIKKGVHRLVCAMKDPNPRVAGRGLRALRSAGVRVRSGVLKEEAADLNRDYSHWIRTKRPFVTLKLAQSRDGRITAGKRGSKWISGAVSRRRAHEIRRSADAVLVGVRTVLADDPRLSVRLKGYRGRQPMKVVLDASLRTPARARLFSGASPGQVLIFTSRGARRRASGALSRRAEIIAVPERRARRLDWPAVLRELGRRGIVHLLIEGGGQVAADALERGIVQELHLFVAPLRVGPSVPKNGLDRSRVSRLFKKWRAGKTGRDLYYQGAV